MRDRLLALSVLVAVFVLSLSGGAGHAQLTEHQARIVFDSGDPTSMDLEIYVVDPDGSHVARLTDSPPGTGSRDAAWSPDRQKIAFVSNRDGDGEVYVMETDGSNVQRLTHTPGENADSAAPEWSPDGQKIVFDSNRDGNFEIYVMDADGSNIQRLTHNDTVDARPAWSPDGRRIVFHSSRDGSSDEAEVYAEFEIYVMDADGGNVQRLTSNDHFDGHPDW